MPPFRTLIAAVALGAAVLAPAPARAAFLFCNHTQSLVEAAFGYRESGGWTSEGWWQLQPGQCARVFNKALTQRFYFYFAHVLEPPAKDQKAPMVWGGKYLFCVDTKAFKVEGDTNCAGRGYREQGFQEVDVGLNQHDYTLNFRDGKSAR